MSFSIQCLDMREFFVDEKVGIPFQMFGMIHLFLIIVTMICFFSIYKNRNKILNLSDRIKQRFKLFTIVLMLLNMIIYYNGYAYYGVYNWKVHLPLHLCFISGFLYMFTLLTKNGKLYHLVYFLGYIGPVPAILLTDLKSVDAYVFFQFIISHHFFLLSNLFMYYAYHIRIEKKDMWRAFMIVHIIFFIMMGFNAIFDTNYLMMNGLPDAVVREFPFLKNIHSPIWVLEITGTVMLLLSYLPVYYRNQELQKDNNIFKREVYLEG